MKRFMKDRRARLCFSASPSSSSSSRLCPDLRRGAARGRAAGRHATTPAPLRHRPRRLRALLARMWPGTVAGGPRRRARDPGARRRPRLACRVVDDHRGLHRALRAPACSGDVERRRPGRRRPRPGPRRSADAGARLAGGLPRRGASRRRRPGPGPERLAEARQAPIDASRPRPPGGAQRLGRRRARAARPDLGRALRAALSGGGNRRGRRPGAARVLRRHRAPRRRSPAAGRRLPLPALRRRRDRRGLRDGDDEPGALLRDPSPARRPRVVCHRGGAGLPARPRRDRLSPRWPDRRWWAASAPPR